MKKRIGSLLLILALCFTLLPTAALAADSNKISITTVDELLQFAKAVDNGEVPSRFMRKKICRLRLNKVSRQ